MKKRTLCVISLLFLFLSSMPAFGGIRNLVVFGDSLSDNGNIFALSGGQVPSPPNVDGRFSDGPVWAEYLAEELGLPGLFLNYAHGGAMSGESNVHDTFPGFLTQVNAYIGQLPLAESFSRGFALPGETLFVIWIGANDFLAGGTDPAATVSGAVTHIQTALTALGNAGATDILVVNLPDLGKTPRMNGDPAVSAGGSQLAALFNGALARALDAFEGDNPEVRLLRLDAFTILSEVIADPASEGFTNVTERKMAEDGTVSDGAYLFWDSIHPTTLAHGVLGRRAALLVDCDDCIGRRAPSFKNGLTLSIPGIEYDGVTYAFDLVPYAPAEGSDLLWKLDMETFTVK